MKRKYSLRLALVLVVLSSFNWAFSIDEIRYTDEEVLEATKEYLKTQNFSDLAFWGLNDEEEISRIEIKCIFYFCAFTQEIIDDNEFVSSDRYWDFRNEWFVPVIVDNEVRSFILMSQKGGTLHNVGCGAALLASNIQRSIEEYTINLDDRLFLIDLVQLIPYGVCYIISAQSKETQNYQFYPILDNEKGYPLSDKIYYNYFSSFERFFECLKTEVYTNVIDVKINHRLIGITINEAVDYPSRLVVYDLNGRIVFSNSILSSKSVSNNVEFPISKSGYYIYNFITPNSIHRGKFLIN